MDQDYSAFIERHPNEWGQIIACMAKVELPPEQLSTISYLNLINPLIYGHRLHRSALLRLKAEVAIQSNFTVELMEVEIKQFPPPYGPYGVKGPGAYLKLEGETKTAFLFMGPYSDAFSIFEVNTEEKR